MNALGNLPLKANGNISPQRFVASDSSGDFLCRQATAGDTAIVGVSQVGTKYPPNLDALLGTTITQYAAVQGDQLEIFANGDVCGITLGVGGCNGGDLLQSDSTGRGVVLTASNWYGFKSFQAGAVNEIVSGVVMIGYR